MVLSQFHNALYTTGNFEGGGTFCAEGGDALIMRNAKKKYIFKQINFEKRLEVFDKYKNDHKADGHCVKYLHQISRQTE